MPAQNPASPVSLLVVCLCAQWCGVCREYQARFDQVQARFPQAQFLWIDVEDEADLLHPLDVEDFPTLLVAVDGLPRFFGPVTPQTETLDRMIRAQLQNPDGTALADPELLAVLARIRADKALD